MSNLPITGGKHIVKLPQVVPKSNVIKHPTQSTQGNTKAIRTAKSAKLATTFHVRFKIQEDAGNTKLLEFTLQLGNHLGKVT